MPDAILQKCADIVEDITDLLAFERAVAAAGGDRARVLRGIGLAAIEAADKAQAEGQDGQA